MGAALLQHVNTTNQLSKLDYNQRLVAKIRKINNYLDAVLPNNRQLVMFLAGSGGTGKSRGIPWHPPSSALPLA
jgi:hypothetical protein